MTYLTMPCPSLKGGLGSSGTTWKSVESVTNCMFCSTCLHSPHMHSVSRLDTFATSIDNFVFTMSDTNSSSNADKASDQQEIQEGYRTLAQYVAETGSNVTPGDDQYTPMLQELREMESRYQFRWQNNESVVISSSNADKVFGQQEIQECYRKLAQYIAETGSNTTPGDDQYPRMLQELREKESRYQSLWENHESIAVTDNEHTDATADLDLIPSSGVEVTQSGRARLRKKRNCQ